MDRPPQPPPSYTDSFCHAFGILLSGSVGRNSHHQPLYHRKSNSVAVAIAITIAIAIATASFFSLFRGCRRRLSRGMDGRGTTLGALEAAKVGHPKSSDGCQLLHREASFPPFTAIGITFIHRGKPAINRGAPAPTGSRTRGPAKDNPRAGAGGERPDFGGQRAAPP